MIQTTYTYLIIGLQVFPVLCKSRTVRLYRTIITSLRTKILHSKLIESIILLLSLTHWSLYQSSSVYSKCFHLSIIHCIPIGYPHIYSSCICFWINDNLKLALRVHNVMWFRIFLTSIFEDYPPPKNKMIYFWITMY